MTRRIVWAVSFRVFLFPFIIFVLVAAWGQDASTGALKGVVFDAQGAVITNADIVAIRVETGIRYHSATDSAGRFVVDLLPPGQYSARAEAEGMSPQVSPAIRVEMGTSAQLTFRLLVAGPKETITVSEAPRTLDANPSSVSALLDEGAIKDLPLNGRRFTDLLLLAPGVTQDPRGLTSGSNGDLSYGGIRGYNTSFLVDGGDNNNGFYAQALGRYRSPYQFSNELVQEFRVQSSGYGAESGRAGGAVVNVVTKSGSNRWHANTFYYLRDSSLGGAAPPFAGFNPTDEQHEFGGTIGGPIQRSKTLLFAGYDQHIFDVPAVVEFRNGATTVVPHWQVGRPLDYEICDPSIGGTACDQAIVPGCPAPSAGGAPCVQPGVLPAAALLSQNAGARHAALMGQTGSVRLDRVLTSHQYLTVRLSAARSYGTNNVTFDPGSPVTNVATSANGEEDVATETASLSLSSGLTPRLTSHLRLQFSRDLEQLFPNTLGTQSYVYGWLQNFGQSSTLPRQTREHRLHVAETLSLNRGRNEWKFGADAMRTGDYNYFPSMYGGKYIFDSIYVDPLTFVPEPPNSGNLKLSPLRAWSHTVMPSWNWDAGSWSGPTANLARYYEQNFGNPVSYPGSSDYAGFVQDTSRLTPHLTLSMGARYDLQTFSRKGMVSNPLWPQAGKMPLNGENFAPRIGIGYAIGDDRPVMVRAGFGVFYTRIPGIYQSAVINNNGRTDNFLSLDNSNYYQHQVFPSYPMAAVNCPPGKVACAIPPSMQQYATSEIAAFAPDFKTPKVQQASLSVEREVAHGLTGTVSYLFVHGINLIRARDVNLPAPTYYSYPIYDSTGYNFQNAFYNVESFSTWQTTHSISCPYPPCINPLNRPIAQLGAIDQFEGAASSFYHGMTVSLRKRMSGGIDFRLAYTWAHAIDNGQDALVAGQPSTVQNSFSARSEKASSVTDQRQRLTISAIEEPNPFAQEQKFLAAIFNHWTVSGIMTYGSGRPANAAVSGDPNQDGNASNDRLSGYGRNAFLGPHYATMDLRVGRRLKLGERFQLQLNAESFNLFNRDNQKYEISDNGYYDLAGRFVRYRQYPVSGGSPYPAYYQQPASLMKPMSAFAPRQMQFSMRLSF